MPYKDPEARRAHRKAEYARDPQGNVEKTRQWRLQNPGRRNESQRKYYATISENHKKRARERQNRYNRAHPDKCYASCKRFRARHPEFHRASEKRRRAAKAHTPLNNFTSKEWEEMKAAHGHRCVYCGRKMQRLTQDHITPLSKGGAHTKLNIVPACGKCNSRKGTGAVLIPVQPLLL
jgi:5-methylcytosine-specific restriction endonuclease McrA